MSPPPGTPSSPETSDPLDPFTPYKDGPAPRVLREIPQGNDDPEVTLQGVVYIAPAASADSASNEIYALIARPRHGIGLPGLLLLHGGEGCADRARASAWARKGYIVIAPELPGIAHPDKAQNSQGAWKQGGYGSGRWTAAPNITSSTIFQGVAAALLAFHLLRTQPGVNTERIGILGISWGGYTTTMVSAMAGRKVAAAFSNYGCGFYEQTTAHTHLDGMRPEEREPWLRFLDAGRRAAHITAPFFIAAASNDFFFWPPAVQATLDMIPGDRNHLYAPNDNHMLNVPGGSPQGDNWAAMAEVFFAHHLQSNQPALPHVTVLAVQNPHITFSITSLHPLCSVAVHYSLPNQPWPQRQWLRVQPVETNKSLKIYEATLPADAWDGGACFLLVSDDRPVSAASRLLTLNRRQP